MEWEDDPDGSTERVAVIMKGEVYRAAGLKHSKHPELEGKLYDILCEKKSSLSRDDVRKAAQGTAVKVKDESFKHSIAWLDDFMRRFCLSKKKTGFYSKNMLKIKGKNAAPPTQNTKRSSRRHVEEDPSSPSLVTADDSSVTPSNVPAESAKPPSASASKHPVPKIKGKRANSLKGLNKENGGQETNKGNDGKVHENGQTTSVHKEDDSGKDVEEVVDYDKTRRKKSSIGNKGNGQLDDSLGNDVDDKQSDVERIDSNNGKEDSELTKSNSDVQQIEGSRTTRSKASNSNENDSKAEAVGSVSKNISKSRTDQKDIIDSISSTSINDPIGEMEVDNEGASGEGDHLSENSKCSNLKNKHTNNVERKEKAAKVVDDAEVGNEKVMNVLSTKEVNQNAMKASKAVEDIYVSEEHNVAGNDTIVLDSEDEEDDIALAIAAADAAVQAAKRNPKMEVDSPGLVDPSAMSADHDTNEDNVVDIAKSPPRFQIKVRNMCELLGGVSPVMNNKETAPSNTVDESISNLDVINNAFDYNMVSNVQKPEKGKSTLMSLFRTTTNHPNAQGSNAVVVRAETPTMIAVKEPLVNKEVTKDKKDDGTSSEHGEQDLTDRDTLSQNKSNKGQKLDLSDESDARTKKDEKFRKKGDKDKDDYEEEKGSTEEDNDEDEEEALADTPDSGSTSEEEKSIHDDLSNDEESDPIVAEVESSGESAADDANEHKKWENENVVSYTKKEDKQYRRSSKELVSNLQTSLLRCTGCNEQVNHHMASLVFTHPVLGVLLCKRCRKFYGTGTFKQDDEGLDEYCRWCANGGDLIVCDKCTYGFCKPCVRRNLSRSALSDIERAKEWGCYVCDIAPLTPLRLQHRAVLDNLREIRKKEISKSRTEKRKSAMSEKFSALKFQRKVKELSSPSKASVSFSGAKHSSAVAKSSTALPVAPSSSLTDKTVNNSAPWLSACMTDLTDMLNVCIAQVGRVQTKWNDQDPPDDASARLQCSRRLLRLMRAMKDNFVTVENKFLDRCGEEKADLLKMLHGMNAEVGEETSSMTSAAAGDGDSERKDTKGGKERNDNNKKVDNDDEDDDEDDISVNNKLDGKKIKLEKAANRRAKLGDSEEQDSKLEEAKFIERLEHETVSDRDDDAAEPMNTEDDVDESTQENDVRRTRSRRGRKEDSEQSGKKPEKTAVATDDSELDKGEADGGPRRSSRRVREVKNNAAEDTEEDSDTRGKKRKRTEKVVTDAEDSDQVEVPEKNGNQTDAAEGDRDQEISDNDVDQNAGLENPSGGDDADAGSDGELASEGRRRSSRTADKDLDYTEMDDKTKTRASKRKRKSTADGGEEENDMKSKKSKKEDQEGDSECVYSKKEKTAVKKTASSSVGACESRDDKKNMKSVEESECEADTESDAQDVDLKRKSPRKSKKKKKKSKDEDEAGGSSSDDEGNDQLPRLSPRKRQSKSGDGVCSDDEEKYTEKKKKSSRKKSKKDKYDDLDSDEFEKRKKAYKKRQKAMRKRDGSTASEEDEDESKTSENKKDDRRISDVVHHSEVSDDEVKSSKNNSSVEEAINSEMGMHKSSDEGPAANDANHSEDSDEAKSLKKNSSVKEAIKSDVDMFQSSGDEPPANDADVPDVSSDGGDDKECDTGTIGKEKWTSDGANEGSDDAEPSVSDTKSNTKKKAGKKKQSARNEGDSDAVDNDDAMSNDNRDDDGEKEKSEKAYGEIEKNDGKKKSVESSCITIEKNSSVSQVDNDQEQANDKCDLASHTEAAGDDAIVFSKNDTEKDIAKDSEKNNEGKEKKVPEKEEKDSYHVLQPDAEKVEVVKRSKPGPKSRVRRIHFDEGDNASSAADKEESGLTKPTNEKNTGDSDESNKEDKKASDKKSKKRSDEKMLARDSDCDSEECESNKDKLVKSDKEEEKDLLAQDFDKDEENLITKVKTRFANEEARETLLASDSENDSKKTKIGIKLEMPISNEEAKKDLLASDSDSNCVNTNRPKKKKRSKLTNEEAKEDLLASDSDEENKDFKKLKIKIKLRSTNEEAKEELLDSDSERDTRASKKNKSKSKASNKTAEYEIMSDDNDTKEEKSSSKAPKKSSKATTNDKAKNDLLASSDSDSAPKKKDAKKKSKACCNDVSLDELLNSDSDISITVKSYKKKSKAGDEGKKAAKREKKKKISDGATESGQEGSSDDSDDCLGIGRDEDDDEEPSVSRRARKRHKASPRQVQQRRQDRQLHKLQAVVQLQTVAAAVQEKLKLQDGSISYKKFKSITRQSSQESKKNDEKKSSKEAKKSEGEDEEGEEHDSDTEFKALMKFKLKKKISMKCTVSDEEDQGEDDENESKEGGEDDKEKKDSSKKGHKKKSKEGLLDIKLNSDSEVADEEDEIEEDDDVMKKKEAKKADPSQIFNEKMKKSLLVSSDEEGREGSGDDSEDSVTRRERELIEQDKKKKYDKLKTKQKEKEKEEDGRVEEEEEDTAETAGEKEEEEKPKAVGKKGYMSLKFSSDEDEDDDAAAKNKKGSKSKDDDDGEDEEEEDDDSDDSDYELQRKSRLFVDSNSDSDFVATTKSRRSTKHKKDSTSSPSESESDLDDKPKKKKRIRKASSSSEEDGAGEVNESVDPTEDTPSKRKHRRIIRDEDLTESTKNATQQEEDRRNRIKERQQVYNKIFEIDVETDQTDLTKLVLDFDPETKKELVSVHPKLVPLLKPHQTQGIKFMWDATCESLERLKQERGSGAILAHCMGLGKTLQVIVFLHTLLTNKRLQNKVRRVMVLCPVNTVYNWVSEFKKWLKGKMLPFEVIELISAKDLWNRAYRLDEWHNETGVCIMGYDMFRTLSNEKNKKYKGKMKEIFQKTLVNPGPDLVICDEGHILKNEKSALSLAVNKIKTPRRVVLTGTPLQNNLKEYHCMIQFVKPNLLGTRKEFLNRFVNPISSGSCADATPKDVKRMKRRAHILHNLLEGCVQRFDYTVLKPFLPPKLEFVISVQMSTLQCELYSYYLENLAQGGPKRMGSGLFVDFNCLSRVWTHPKVLELQTRRAFVNEDEEDLEDFICDDETSESSEDDRPKKKKKVSEEEKSEESKPPSPEDDALPDGLKSDGRVRADWWKKIVSASVDSQDLNEEEWMNKIELSGKLVLLLSILRECCGIGDKVLLFSQSILALDMIEEFLALIDRGELEMPSYEGALPLQFKHWKRERDYLRLDGSVSADIRKSQCKYFNEGNNDRCRLFLISTRAGGIGINLVAANRVIIFDSSWNPAHDTQSIFRVYRFGQKKPCYVYRFVAQGTMEEKIYSRQVNKLSTSLRVVDEHQIKRYFNTTELADLYEFNPADQDVRETPIVPEDRLLAELIIRHKKWIVGYHEHDSLLENQTSEELSEEERKAAWEDFENEKKGFGVPQFAGRAPATAGAYTGGSMPFPTSIPAFDLNQVIQSIYSQESTRSGDRRQRA